MGFSSRPAAGRTLDPQSRPPALFSVEDEARRGARVWGDEADAWGVKSHPWPLSLHVSGAHGSGRPCCRARLPRQALSAGPRRVGPAFRERTDRRGGQTRRRPKGNVAGTGTGGRPRARGAPRKWGAAQAGRLHPQGVIDSPALPSATVPNTSEAYARKRLRRRCQDSLSTGLCKAIPEKAVQGRRGWTAHGFSAATYFQTA